MLFEYGGQQNPQRQNVNTYFTLPLQFVPKRVWQLWVVCNLKCKDWDSCWTLSTNFRFNRSSSFVSDRLSKVSNRQIILHPILWPKRFQSNKRAPPQDSKVKWRIIPHFLYVFNIDPDYVTFAEERSESTIDIIINRFNGFWIKLFSFQEILFSFISLSFKEIRPYWKSVLYS